MFNSRSRKAFAATIGLAAALMGTSAWASKADQPIAERAGGGASLVEPMPLFGMPSPAARAAETQGVLSFAGEFLAAADAAIAAAGFSAAETTGSIARATPAGGAARAHGRDLLASVAIGFGKLPALERMAPVYADMKAGIFRDCRSASCDNARATLRTVVASGRGGPFLKLLSAVNRSVNTLIAYRRDKDIYGTADYWATPSATLASGVGDCEDFAILKLAVLASAGVPDASMSVVVIKDERREVYHAVLAVTTSRGAYILDNLSETVRRDVELPNYMPLYAISAGRGFIYGRCRGMD